MLPGTEAMDIDESPSRSWLSLFVLSDEDPSELDVCATFACCIVGWELPLLVSKSLLLLLSCESSHESLS